jgi:hypothetical protein
MQRIVAEYCHAHEHADFAYHETVSPEPDFSRNTCFNWLVEGNGSGDLEAERVDGGLTYRSIPYEQRIVEGIEIDCEPMLTFFEQGGSVRGWIQYRWDRFSSVTVASFIRLFDLLLTTLIETPQIRLLDEGIRSRVKSLIPATTHSLNGGQETSQ